MGLLSSWFGGDSEPRRVDDRVTAEARTRWSYPSKDGSEGAVLVEQVRSDFHAVDPDVERPSWARDWDRGR
ncbi:MAG: hypothetical protein AAF467_24655 [Actinomycetota bacterium]